MSPKNLPLFITFEGTEGAGKSTLIRHVAQRIDALDSPSSFPVLVTREPGGNTVAEKIRSLILNEPMSPWTELFLYEAARAEHLSQTVLPALKEGRIVLCDRFTDSTLAYQSNARGLPWSEVKRLNRIATQNLVPDLTVLVDIDPAVGLSRAKDPNRFENEGVGFQQKVRAGFLRSRRESPKRWFTINSEKFTAEENAEKIAQEIIRRFLSKSGQKRPRSSRRTR